MRRSALSLFALAPLALVACGPTVPESGAGVGFGDYNGYNAQREAALTNGAPMVAPGAQPIMGGGVGAQPLGATAAPTTGFSAERIGAAIDSAGGAPSANGGFVGTAPLTGPLSGMPADPLAAVPMAPIPMTPAPMAAPVASVPVQNLPTRAGNSANIVQYALTTTNGVGQSMYDRPSLTMRNPEKACGAFSSPDQAQAAFLDAGGPQKDRKGLDPDGDGFACAWDPTRFRKAVQ